jgi:cobalt transporter subunit CbtA
MPYMTRGMPMAFPATRPLTGGFRPLMVVALLAGTIAGLFSFAVQHFTVVPLIKTAETYETASLAAMPGMTREAEEWEPAEGWERTCFTALGTILSGVGFSSIFFGVLGVAGVTLTPRSGALWGLAGFACFALAPALGLPPQPPGVPVADLQDRQLWWAATAVATSVGLWLLLGNHHNWLRKAGGVICLVLPHAVGAPRGPANNIVPVDLVHHFVVASLASSGLFWLLLGSLGGFLQSRREASFSASRIPETL